MKMTKIVLAAAAPLALLASTAADAAVLVYSLSGSYTGVFTIDESRLPPSMPNADYFEVEGNGTLDGVTGPQTIAFNTIGNSGGLTTGFPAFTNLFGDQLFTGTTAAPVLRTGSFTLLLDGDATQEVTLDVSVAAVPEPATWGMMVLGFGAAGVALRRRRYRRAPVA